MRFALLIALAACAPKPTFLGTEVPKPCTTRDAEGCLGWMMERDLLAAELGIYDNPSLRGYVQRVVARLARVSNLGATPRVMIADHDETYATAGRRIIIARTTIEKLESEAELAAILAHELAHIEARHVMVSLFGRPESDHAGNRRDAEAIADERAVALLEKAGYAPAAMATALSAVLVDIDDEDHPPRLERIARVTKLAAGRGGFEGRAEFLANIDGMIVGSDVRLGHRVDDAWVIPALSLALDLAPDDRIVSDTEVLAVRRGKATILAYAVGAPWARELAARFDAKVAERAGIGRITRGTMQPPSTRDTSPLGKLARAIRATLPQPAAGTQVAIVERRKGALVVELGGDVAPDLRAATAAELAASQPNRIVIVRAKRAGTIGSLGACAGRLLERSDRVVEVGAPIKCAARRVDDTRVAAH